VDGDSQQRSSSYDATASAMTDRVAEWNRTEAEFDTTRCVHQEIEQSARRRPRQAAIIFRDRVLTYQ